jgi:3'-phosphoadenosine 5'-phosphosulfate sulfotransferase (PAPS reductase)/FAD synthetase
MTDLPIIISSSFGRTSAYMTDEIIARYPGRQLYIVFANTGEERTETLEFGQLCAERWAAKGHHIVLLEAVIHPKKKVGTSYRYVTFTNAYRPEYSWNPDYGKEEGFENPLYHPKYAAMMATRPVEWGHPFEAMIAKYGVANNSFPHCTREVKIQAIGAWIKDHFAPGQFEMALGIRADEQEREGKWWYPLIDWGVTKGMVRAYWRAQPFDLELADYEGNCATCWKKGLDKNLTLLEQLPVLGLFFLKMERLYSHITPADEDRRMTKAMRPLPLLDTLDVLADGLPAKKAGPFHFNHNGVSMKMMYEMVKRGKFRRIKDNEDVRSCACGVEFENLMPHA